jgi:hypothetical protein
LFAVSVLALSVFVETVNATLMLENTTTWHWNYYTKIASFARGDIDGDGAWEIVTGGYYNDGSRYVAQLCVWDGSTLALENVATWYWTSDTHICSVAVGDVDADGSIEIVTGGYHDDGSRYVAQLCVWDGSTLALENVATWYWTSNTYIKSIAVANLDGFGAWEIVTGGYYHDGTRNIAQLCIWDGASLALEKVKTWYWTSHTYIYSVAAVDVDSDANMEVLTGGSCHDGTREIAQLCVWDGSTLALEKVKTWYWTSNNAIYTVAVGNVDNDMALEVITGGYYYDGHYNAQLCVWNGATLELENVQSWYWTSSTFIKSIAVSNVDADAQKEIVTGGYYYDGRYVAQLCVWGGSTLALKNIKTWPSSNDAFIESVSAGDVDSDGQTEIITGGRYNDGVYDFAQLCVWA